MPDDGGWQQRVHPPGVRWALWAAVGLVVLVVVLQQWLLAVMPLLLTLITLRSVIDVRVDATGLTVRSLLGRPRLHVPASDIVRAEVREHVSPLSEFGGHGWRTSPGGTVGVVVREGAAVVVRRGEERPLLVTVDDAPGAAAAVDAVARAARGR